MFTIRIFHTFFITISYLYLLLTINSVSAKVEPEQIIKTGGFQYSIAPMPNWVSSPSGVGQSNGSSPMYYDLIDNEVLVGPQKIQRFTHIIRVVSQPAGLEAATQISTAFDPNYQTLIFHRLDIVRDGKHIDKLASTKLKLLQRETSLEERLYNGKVTVNIDLDDVRVGDKIEYAYTINGQNPVFNGMFSDLEFVPAIKGEIQHYQYRLLTPSDRTIYLEADDKLKVVKRQLNGQTETLVTDENVPQFHYDQQTPDSSYINQYIQVSEYKSWADVAAWGESLFEFSQYENITAKVDEIRSSADSVQAQVIQAVDFVQNDIRYLGLEIGQNSHRPNQPNKVLEQRYGDCKDKTLLLIALLKELGIEASPVLVSTYYNIDTAKLLPNPLVFNHVIANISIGNQSYYIDGTRQFQRGDLAQRQPKWFGKGLVLKRDITSLANLPFEIGRLERTVDDVFEVESFTKAPTLKSTITYFGSAAERVRRLAANVTSEELNEMYLHEYGQVYPSLERFQLVSMNEAEDNNSLVVSQAFKVPDYWKYYEEKILLGNALFWSLLMELPKPTASARKLAYGIHNPSSFEHNVTVKFPEEVAKPSKAKTINDDNAVFSYQSVADSTSQETHFKSKLTYKTSQIAPSDWKPYARKALKARDKMGGLVRVPAIKLSRVKQLDNDLRSLPEKIRKSRRNKPFDKYYIELSAQELLLEAQLESGRLKPKFRSEALKHLAEYQDDLGKFGKAKSSFEEAIMLSPENAELHASYAYNALALGDFERSKMLINKAIELDSTLTYPLRLRIYGQYFNEEYDAAQLTEDEYIQKAEATDKWYGRIWQYLTLLRRGESTDNFSSQIQAMNDVNGEWQHTIINVLLGQQDYDDVEDIVRDEEDGHMKLCELYYYLGEHNLIKGNTRKARKFFKKSIKTGATQYVEYQMSNMRLASTK